MATEQLEHLSEFIDVDDLMNRCLGNLDFATRILDVLNELCQADLDELESALTVVDTQRIAEVSHRLKGAFANSAAYGMSKQADELCISANQDMPAEMTDHLARLRHDWDQFTALIKKQNAPHN